MFCPECGKKTKVVDSRWDGKIKVVKRKHRCDDCEINYFTAEKVYEQAKAKKAKKKDG